MPSDLPQVQIDYTLEFKRNVGRLAKRYRHIRSDVRPVIDQLASGDFVGDRISGTSYLVFKVRIKNSDIAKGKSAGYRMIYQVKDPMAVVLVAIYSKSDQSDIAAGEIRQIIRGFERGNS